MKQKIKWENQAEKLWRRLGGNGDLRSDQCEVCGTKHSHIEGKSVAGRRPGAAARDLRGGSIERKGAGESNFY